MKSTFLTNILMIFFLLVSVQSVHAQQFNYFSGTPMTYEVPKAANPKAIIVIPLKTNLDTDCDKMSCPQVFQNAKIYDCRNTQAQCEPQGSDKIIHETGYAHVMVEQYIGGKLVRQEGYIWQNSLTVKTQAKPLYDRLTGASQTTVPCPDCGAKPGEVAKLTEHILSAFGRKPPEIKRDPHATPPAIYDFAAGCPASTRCGGMHYTQMCTNPKVVSSGDVFVSFNKVTPKGPFTFYQLDAGDNLPKPMSVTPEDAVSSKNKTWAENNLAQTLKVKEARGFCEIGLPKGCGNGDDPLLSNSIAKELRSNTVMCRAAVAHIYETCGAWHEKDDAARKKSALAATQEAVQNYSIPPGKLVNPPSTTAGPAKKSSRLSSALVACVANRENNTYLPDKVNYEICMTDQKVREVSGLPDTKNGVRRSYAFGLMQMTPTMTKDLWRRKQVQDICTNFSAYFKKNKVDCPGPFSDDEDGLKAFTKLTKNPYFQMALGTVAVNDALTLNNNSVHDALNAWFGVGSPYTPGAIKQVTSCLQCIQSKGKSLSTMDRGVLDGCLDLTHPEN